MADIVGFVEFIEVVCVRREILRSTALRWIVRGLSQLRQVSRRLQRCSNEPRRAVVRRRQQVPAKVPVTRQCYDMHWIGLDWIGLDWIGLSKVFNVPPNTL